MIRVLLVDDSPVVRRVFAGAIAATPDMCVVGEAPDPYVARDRIVRDAPDVVVLDIEMPRMDGLTFLRKLMRHHPMPVVICSSLSVSGGEVALEAMASGAIEVICKPSQSYSVARVNADLVAAIRRAAEASTARRDGGEPRGRVRVTPTSLDDGILVAIGASTGGTVAVEEILCRLPTGGPPIVIAQHMPEYITKPFAERLARVAGMDVREAVDGDWVDAGTVLVARGGKHLLVERAGRRYRACVKDGPLVTGHRPSVDVLFQSVARAAGASAVGVLLTGMGRDGARGLLAMRQAGAHTLAQDEATSVVFGMPKVAIELGAADEVVALSHVAERIVGALRRRATVA